MQNAHARAETAHFIAFIAWGAATAASMLPLSTFALPMPSNVNSALLTAALTQNFSRKGTKLPVFIAFIAFMAFIACRHGQSMMYSAQQKPRECGSSSSSSSSTCHVALNRVCAHPGLPAIRFLTPAPASARHVNVLIFWCLR